MSKNPELPGGSRTQEDPFKGPDLPVLKTDELPQVADDPQGEGLLRPVANAMGRFHTAAENLTVKSALNPVLWLCAMMCIPFLVATYVFRGDPFLKVLFACTAVAPVVICCILSIGFAVFAPDRLQSEFYQLRQRLMQVVQQRAGRFSMESLIQAISNPRDRDA